MRVAVPKRRKSKKRTVFHHRCAIRRTAGTKPPTRPTLSPPNIIETLGLCPPLFTTLAAGLCSLLPAHSLSVHEQALLLLVQRRAVALPQRRAARLVRKHLPRTNQRNIKGHKKRYTAPQS